MIQISNRSHDIISAMYVEFIVIKCTDNSYLEKDCNTPHDSIEVIRRINEFIEVGESLDISFWETIKNNLGRKRLEEIKSLHKKCKLAENKRR